MKTEKEFSDYFISESNLKFDANSESEAYLISVANSYWSDLTSHLAFYFSNEDRLLITQKAAIFISQRSKYQSLDEAWKTIIRDFNQNDYWGFRRQLSKPKSVQTEEQQIFWKIFKYTWAFFQAMVILKIAVYYFGLESAQNPDQTPVGWVWFFFGLSVVSLFFFAYRNRHDKT